MSNRRGNYDFSFQHWVGQTYALQARPLAFNAETVEQWKQWRADLRQKVMELAGLTPPPEACDLAADVLERVELPEDRLAREKVAYQSSPEVWVPAWVLRPLEPTTRRLPAVLALHGHGGRWGKDQVAGVIGENDSVRKSIDRYNYDFGRQFAKRGYVVLCPDAFGFGERIAGWEETDKRPRGYDPCDRASNKAALLGFSLTGMTIWDDRRGIDYLQSRPDVDAQRIGVAGFSLGGRRATYLSAVDERPRATIISGSLGTFKSKLLHGNGGCAMQILPHLYALGRPARCGRADCSVASAD